jgi:hypothetical protein
MTIGSSPTGASSSCTSNGFGVKTSTWTVSTAPLATFFSSVVIMPL